eukprot:TRINITY_DN801_c0_g1_i4.p2 TRINITY_DN801_c0_g1~~TRINITY_DN801_c0_g1_i4.p2  ORF type:complete len:309 (+),score=123.02 TRINITY_DN801_c0_g1_i4:86-928(+)
MRAFALLALGAAARGDAPYAGQTGAPSEPELSDNCWKNVTLKAPGKRALIVTTSYGDKLPSGQKTGLTLEEAVEPYYVYQGAGMTVDVASIRGGQIPYDAVPPTPAVGRFQLDRAAKGKFANSTKIDDVDFTQYDVVFMAGGWGAAFDLGFSVPLGQRVAAALSAGRPMIASTCHGALGFVQANMTDGTPWVKGRKMTGVTNAQIKKLGITDQTPMHPEEELRKLGADYQCIHGTGILGDLGASSVSVDLSTKAAIVTGQNQVASCVTAQRQLLFFLAQQ